MLNCHVSKEIATVYKMRFDGTHTWANITLMDDGPGRGSIQIQSDYGDFSYFWGAMGEGKDIRKFLISCKNDPDYLIGKMAKRDYYDQEASIAEVESFLRELHAQEPIKKFDEVLEQVKNMPAENQYRFYDDLMEIEVLSDCLSDLEPVMDYDPQIKMFMERVFPKFIEILEAEIK